MLYSLDYQVTGDDTLHALPSTSENLPAYPETDEQLMRQIQGGDDAALGILLYRHRVFCRRIILNVVRHEGDADRLAEQLFTDVARESRNYRPENGPALGWIVTLARHKAIAALRRRQEASQRLAA